MINVFRNEYEFLSNFYPCVITVDNITYQSVEHAFQACKTDNLNTKVIISRLSTSQEAKVYGNNKALVAVKDGWNEERLDVMLMLIRQKFTNTKLRKKLLRTTEELVHGNFWQDRFWGVHPVHNGTGKNHLGKILMQVREEIRGE